jgi:hypothetical protein
MSDKKKLKIEKLQQKHGPFWYVKIKFTIFVNVNVCRPCFCFVFVCEPLRVGSAISCFSQHCKQHNEVTIWQKKSFLMGCNR